MKLFSALGDLLFPKKCLFCGRKCGPGKYSCEACGSRAEHLERVYQLKTGRSGEEGRPFTVRSPYRFEGFYQTALYRLKFRGVTAYARSFADLICAAGILPEEPVDVVAFVPMWEPEEKRRGYNQAELIAVQIARNLRVPCQKLLKQVRPKSLQHNLRGTARRRENVRGVFEAQGEIAGKRVLLADDIVTTGATMCEGAKVLYRAGAAQVYGVCAADTPLVRKDPTAGEE